MIMYSYFTFLVQLVPTHVCMKKRTKAGCARPDLHSPQPHKFFKKFDQIKRCLAELRGRKWLLALCCLFWSKEWPCSRCSLSRRKLPVSPGWLQACKFSLKSALIACTFNVVQLSEKARSQFWSQFHSFLTTQVSGCFFKKNSRQIILTTNRSQIQQLNDDGRHSTCS